MHESQQGSSNHKPGSTDFVVFENTMQHSRSKPNLQKADLIIIELTKTEKGLKSSYGIHRWWRFLRIGFPVIGIEHLEGMVILSQTSSFYLDGGYDLMKMLKTLAWRDACPAAKIQSSQCWMEPTFLGRKTKKQKMTTPWNDKIPSICAIFNCRVRKHF